MAPGEKLKNLHVEIITLKHGKSVYNWKSWKWAKSAASVKSVESATRLFPALVIQTIQQDNHFVKFYERNKHTHIPTFFFLYTDIFFVIQL